MLPAGAVQVATAAPALEGMEHPAVAPVDLPAARRDNHRDSQVVVAIQLVRKLPLAVHLVRQPLLAVQLRVNQLRVNQLPVAVHHVNPLPVEHVGGEVLCHTIGGDAFLLTALCSWFVNLS